MTGVILKSCSVNFRTFDRKTPVLQVILNKVPSLKYSALPKRGSDTRPFL